MLRTRLAGRFVKLGVGADIGITLVLQVVSAGVMFAIQALIYRSLSKIDAGTYTLTNSFMTIAGGLGDFGLLAVLTPRLSVARGASTPSFFATLHLRALAIVLSWFLMNGYLLASGKTDLILYFNVGILWIFFSAKASGLRQVFEVLWRLKGRTYLITAIGVADVVLGLIMMLIASRYTELTVLKALLIMALCNVPGSLVVIIPLLSKLRGEGLFRFDIPGRLYRALVKAAFPIAVMGLLGQVSGQLETLIIESSSLMSRADIAAYNAGIRPLVGTIFVPVALSYGLIPLIVQVSKGVRSDHSLAFIVSFAIRALGLISLGICVASAVFAEQIIGIFGKQFVEDAYILRAYSVVNVIIYFVIMFDHFLLGLGKRKQTLYGAIINVAIALALEPFAIAQWGIRGMIGAKLIALFGLITFQLVCIGSEGRSAALKGMARLLPGFATLIVALLLTAGMPVIIQGTIVLLSVALVVMLNRTIRFSELQSIRTMRIH